MRGTGVGRGWGARSISLVIAVVLTGSIATAGPGSSEPARTASAPATGVVPDSILSRYLTRRPPVGTVRVADIAGATSGQRLLAATLQGIVNRQSARLYLVGMRSSSEDQFWLTDYTQRGLITVGASGDLDAAVAAFGGEVTGYVIASEAEPWTINTATTVAAATGGVVATPELVAGLQARGLTQIDDHRGRWPDDATAYEAIAAAYQSQLPYQGLAIQETDRHQPRDFYVQQGIMTVFTRPSAPDYDRVYNLLDPLPNEHPVYGYVADTGSEEVLAVARLALAGRFLVPTNTSDNLSFHLAVAASKQRVVPPANTSAVAPCSADTVNVVLSMSDGDNLSIAEGIYAHPDQWSSARRGELPLGWSLGPSTAILMPSVWDHYGGSATRNDEIVGMMGLGYTYTSLLPNGAQYFADSFTLDAVLGLRTHWSLDALLTQPGAGGWPLVQAGAARAGVKPDGILLNYLNFGGPAWYRTVDDIPVFTSKSGAYEDGPDDLAVQIGALVNTPADQRSLVTFFSVTVWNSNYDALADAMAPLTAQGVRFLTPAEAVACLPQPPPSTTTPTTAASNPPSSSTAVGGGPAASPSSAVAVRATPRFTG